jgi:hypothetical protein
MTVALPLAFPGSRVLAGWWRQIAPGEPRAFWVGRLLLHHVEALVQVNASITPDRLSQLVLNALALQLSVSGVPHEPRHAPAFISLAGLDQAVHLGSSTLRQILRGLEKQNLVATSLASSPRASDGLTEGWTLTPSGRSAAERGSYPISLRERRVFYFVRAGTELMEFHFLNFAEPDGASSAALPIDESLEFHPELLIACVHQTPAWKTRHGFPLDVTEVLPLPGQPSGAASGLASVDKSGWSSLWQRVILDRPCYLFVVLLLGQVSLDRLTAFAVKPEGWKLHGTDPCFALGAAVWPELFPVLATATPLEVWRQAWRGWCQPRNLPAQETDACELEHVGARLRVRMSKRLVERLRAIRSDALKGEAWILAGEGPLRPAALIEVIER